MVRRSIWTRAICASRSLLATSEQKFTYVRYGHAARQCKEMSLLPPALQASIDNLKLIPTLQQVGRDYADHHVQLSHLYPRQSVAPAR